MPNASVFLYSDGFWETDRGILETQTARLE